MPEPLLVLTNVPDVASARIIARQLVDERIAACVNIMPQVESVYHWQGVVEEAGEVTLLIKTTRGRYADLETAIRAAHPHEVPEIIAVPIVAGLPEYIDWIAKETTGI